MTPCYVPIPSNDIQRFHRFRPSDRRVLEGLGHSDLVRAYLGYAGQVDFTCHDEAYGFEIATKWFLHKVREMVGEGAA